MQSKIRPSRHFQSRFLFLLLFLLLLPAAFAQGGPPLITDDPGTPGNKHWEINTAFTQTRLVSGVSYEFPHLDLNYGYGENLQLKFEGPFTIFNGNNGDNFTTPGYYEWGVKWRFQDESKSRPAISTYPQVFFVGNERLAQLGIIDPGIDVFLPVEVMRTFGKFQLDGEAGIMIRQFDQPEYWSGICAEYDLTKSFAFLGEIHLVDTAAFGQDQIIWNLGFKKDLSENQSLLFSAGRTFASPTGDNPGFMMYVGLQVRI